MQGYLGRVAPLRARFRSRRPAATFGKFRFKPCGAAVRRRAGGVSARARRHAWTAPSPLLNVDDWLALTRAGASGGSASGGEWTASFAGAELEVARVLGVRAEARHARKRQRAPAHRRLAVRARQQSRRGHAARARGPRERAADRRRHAALCLISPRAAKARMAKVDPRESAGAAAARRRVRRRPAADSGGSTPRSCPIRWACGSSRSRARPTASARRAAAAGSWATTATPRGSRSASLDRRRKMLDQLGFDPVRAGRGRSTLRRASSGPGRPRATGWITSAAISRCMRRKAACSTCEPGAPAASSGS